MSIPATPLPPVTLVLGGQRSGKSAYAESLIESAGGGIYLATAEPPESHPDDTEMAERIAQHRARRGAIWTTAEEPIDLLTALKTHGAGPRPVLVDCLTLWISNLLHAEKDVIADAETLAQGLPGLAAPVVFVSNEVGLGGVAMNALARRFADCTGRVNQIIAQQAQRVVFVTAGLPHVLKDDT